MTRTFPSFVPALALALLASCGGNRGAAATAAAEQELASLLPADTVAFVRVAAIDSLAAHVREIVEAMGEDASKVDVDAMLKHLGPMGGDTKLIDRDRPLGVSLSLVKGRSPSPLFLVPAKDPAAYAASLGQTGFTAVAAGGYVVIKLHGAYEKPKQASTMAKDLPAGMVSLRADVAKLVETFGPVISASISAFEKQMARDMQTASPGSDGEAMAEMYGKVARSVLASTTSMDFGIDYRDGRMTSQVCLQAKPGSDLDGWGSPPIDLKGIESRMTGKGSFEAVMVADWARLWPRVEGMMTALFEMYPAPTRELMQGMMGGYREVYENIGSVVAIEGDIFGDHGLDITTHFGPESATKLRSTIEAMLARPELKNIGVSVNGPTASDVGGVSVSDYELGIDQAKLAKAMFGDAAPSGSAQTMLSLVLGNGGVMRMRLATKGDRAAVGLGQHGDSAAQSVDRSGGACTAATHFALQQLADCNPLVVERLDMGATMRGAAKMKVDAGGNPPAALPADANAEVTVFGGVHGSDWRLGVSFDVLGFAKVIHAMRSR